MDSNLQKLPHENPLQPEVGEKHWASFLRLSEDNKNYIKENYLKLPTVVVARAIKRPGSALKSFAILLGLPSKRSLCRRADLESAHVSWRAMKQRCLDKNNCKYPRYGGAGITIDSRWFSYDEFLKDMGPRPEGMTLDRIDPMGNYEPSNCRWATPKVQARQNIKYDGVMCCDCCERRPSRKMRCGRCNQYFREMGKPRPKNPVGRWGNKVGERERIAG